MVAQAKLSARVPLIGMPALPPSYFDLFARLAACIDVHLFLIIRGNRQVIDAHGDAVIPLPAP